MSIVDGVFQAFADWLTNNPAVESYLIGLASRLRGFAGTWTFGLSESLNYALGNGPPEEADFQQGEFAGFLSSIPFLASALEKGILGLAFQTTPDGVQILRAGSRALENAHAIGFIPFSTSLGRVKFFKPKPVVVSGFPTANVSRVVTEDMVRQLVNQAYSNRTGNNSYVNLLVSNFRQAPAANRYAFFSQDGRLKAIGYVFDKGNRLSPDMVASGQFPMPIREFIQTLLVRARKQGATIDILPASPELAKSYSSILSNASFQARAGFRLSKRPVFTDIEGVNEMLIVTPN